MFIDQLENRRLFTAIPALPDFSGKITSKIPQLIIPGQSITVSLSISNSGASLKKTSLPIGIYFSDDDSIADAASSAIEQVTLAIPHGKTAKANLKNITVPLDVPAGSFYLIFLINDNTNDTAVPQISSTTSDTVVSPQIYNPIDEYDSTVTGDSNDDISLYLYQSDSGVVTTDCSVDTDANFGSTEVDNLKTTISSIGKFSATGIQGDASSGEIDSATITGTLKVVDGQLVLAGNFKVSVNIIGDPADSGTAASTFQATGD